MAAERRSPVYSRGSCVGVRVADRGIDGGHWGWLLFLPALAILAAAGALGAWAISNHGSEQAIAAETLSGDGAWLFVSTSMTELSATTLQVCSAEAALAGAKNDADKARWQDQQITLMARYERQAQAYDRAVSDRVAQGTRRPWDVSPVAPPIAVLKQKACLRTPYIPPKPTPTGGSLPPPGTPFDDPGDRFLSLEQLDAAAVAAGWPMADGWWPDMRKIIQCETHSLDRMAWNQSDPNGGSYGLAQLNGEQHFIASGEDFNQRFDPVVNLRVALWLRTVRGHFGGPGGWMICSERWGIE